MIVKRCSNVKKLMISNVEMDQGLMPLQPLFAKLDHFIMERGISYSDLKTVQDMDETMTYLLEACDNLKTFHLKRLHPDGSISISHSKPIKFIGRKFKLLQEARIDGFDVTHDALEIFIEQNPTLNKLIVKSCNNENRRSTEVFGWIRQHLINLTELEFDEMFRGEKDFQSLSGLRLLRVLKLNFRWSSVTPLMEGLAANDIPIEHLKLSCGIVDSETIKAISKLKQIKIFETFVSNEMTDDYLIELSKELPQLRQQHLKEVVSGSNISPIEIAKAISHANRLSLIKLDLIGRIKIEVNDYNAILKSVLNRPENTKLVIDIKNEGIDVDVSEEILHQFVPRGIENYQVR